jgi:hypothetical protein
MKNGGNCILQFVGNCMVTSARLTYRSIYFICVVIDLVSECKDSRAMKISKVSALIAKYQATVLSILVIL